MVISLPDVPAGENPFAFWRWTVRGLLNPTATDGFGARLDVLFALMGYGIVVSFLYLGAMFLEYRRRNKRWWLWRLVTRPNGRYIVGNQHAIFALCTIVSCGILIGYAINARRVVLLLKYQQRAFFWRSFVWVPLIIHAWLSSWANLQAAILSSQKATNQHLLSPRFANSFYIGGLVVLLVPVIILDAYSGFSWHRVWSKALVLKAAFISLAASSPTMPQDQAAQAIAAPLDALNDQLNYFGKTQRAVAALYAFTMVVLVAVNLGGLGLLFTLRKQIKFNSRRLSGHIRSATLPGGPSSMGYTPPVAPTTPTSAYFPGSTGPDPLSPEPPHPLSPQTDDATAPHSAGLIRKVLFASQAKNADPEYRDDKMTVSQLKHAASDKTTAGAAQREQAKQLLALKKIEWDLYVFIAAIILLATCFFALAMWLCIAPASVYSNWPAMETAFFLVPWLYLVGVCTSLSFLLFNAVRHLLSAKSRLHRGRQASVVGLGGRLSQGRDASGLTFSDELTSETFSRPGPAEREPQGVIVERQVVIEMEEEREESPRGTPCAK
ncbi:hypothetical protein JCM10213_008645 [Rhodosporidiobolus nylandii]